MTSLKRYAADTRGSVAILFGLSLIILCLFVGLAIDTARVYSMTKKVQDALDAAALAGAKALNESDGQANNIRATAYAAFLANIAHIPNGAASFSGFDAVPDLSNSTVTAGVQLKVPSTFAKLAGLDEFNVQKSSSTTYSLAHIEVVLALDTTGSMKDIPAGDTIPKIQAMKGAAATLIDSVYGEATTDSNVRISVVPWSTGVLAGGLTSAVSGGSGGGCLVERAGHGATDDSQPGPLSYALPLPGTSIALGYACPTVAAMPLQGRTAATSIKKQIQSLTGAGGTAGHIGAAWAWYTLSANWASLLPTASQPAAPSRSVVKVAVIMTDGIFNTTHVGGVLDAAPAYNSNSYAMFKTICDGMRAQGITVYTVAFDLTDTTALDKLAECSGANALTAATSVQLQQVFRKIAADLSSIRVTR